MSAAKHVAGVQRHLEAIYDLDLGGARARDFLVGDAELAALEADGVVAPSAARPEEELLVLPGDQDEVEVALYLSDRVRASLARGPGLQDHCHVTEGVSHFVMVAWSARERRSVRPLDLELQAEVDKAGTVLLLDRGANGGAGGRRLLRRLFHDVDFDARLDREERRRYRTAHRLGAAYAHRLASLLDEGVDALLAELRRFYRLTPDDKLAHAARRAA